MERDLRALKRVAKENKTSLPFTLKEKSPKLSLDERSS
jgi:hypothetical protein